MTVFPLPFSLFLPIPRPNCSCEGMGKETMRSIFFRTKLSIFHTKGEYNNWMMFKRKKNEMIYSDEKKKGASSQSIRRV